jgi:hypothetical protein
VTQPAIVSVSSEVIDNSGVAVYWEGRAKRWIYCGTRRGVFDVSDSSLNGIAMDASSVITDWTGAPRIILRWPYSSAGIWRIQHDHVGDHAIHALHFVGGRDGYRQLGGGGFRGTGRLS